MVAERNPQIEQAVVKLRRLSDDERARDLYGKFQSIAEVKIGVLPNLADQPMPQQKKKPSEFLPEGFFF